MNNHRMDSTRMSKKKVSKSTTKKSKKKTTKRGRGPHAIGPSLTESGRRFRRLMGEIGRRLQDSPRGGENEQGVEAADEYFTSSGSLVYLKVVEAVTQRLGGELIAQGGLVERYDAKKGVFEEVTEGLVHRILKGLIQYRIAPSHAPNAMKMLLNEHERPGEEATPDPNTICLQNGVVDPAHPGLMPHSPKYRHRSQVPYAYDPEATCPLWLKTLDEIFEGDAELTRLLQQIFGYCLTHDTGMQVFFVFVGSGANGKGVVTSTLRNILGSENVTAIPPEKFGKDFVLASLRGKLANMPSETSARRAAPAAVLKALTGEDVITCDVKYKPPMHFISTAKQIISCNDMIRFDDDSHGLMRRVVAVPFSRTFAENERDPRLVEKLAREASGILNWAMQGLRDLRKEGRFVQPAKSLALKDQFARTQNPVLDFVEECCELGPEHRIRRVDLYRTYVKWHELAGVPGRPISNRDLYDKLVASFSGVHKVHSGDNYFQGIRMSKAPREAEFQPRPFVNPISSRYATTKKKKKSKGREPRPN